MTLINTETNKNDDIQELNSESFAIPRIKRREFKPRNQQKIKVKTLEVENYQISDEFLNRGEISIFELRNLGLDNLLRVIGIDPIISNINNINDAMMVVTRALQEMGVKLVADGFVKIAEDGYGFVKKYSDGWFLKEQEEVYISQNQIKRCGIRFGDNVFGVVRPPKHGEKHFAMLNVEKVNSIPVSELRSRKFFDDLTAIYPDRKINLEVEPDKTLTKSNKKTGIASRIIDIMTPIGCGQRGLIVAPARVGKTMLLKDVINSITKNHPDIIIMALLIGERPEEVTEMKRSINGEVYSSTFDELSQRHVELSEMVIQRAKRLVELGRDVVIMLDSITRLARAYNNVMPSSGKVLSGGVDSNALYMPKKFFGAARNTEDGGSLTIIATALIETGSRMDEVIFEEFKGTGNLEIVLDKKIADKRIFPAIDISKSGTRRDDLLLESSVFSKVEILRRIMAPLGAVEAIEMLVEKMGEYKTNEELFVKMFSTSKNKKPGEY